MSGELEFGRDVLDGGAADDAALQRGETGIRLAAGSAISFGPMIIHGSDANRSGNERRACTIAYNVTGNGEGRCRETLRTREAVTT